MKESFDECKKSKKMVHVKTWIWIEWYFHLDFLFELVISSLYHKFTIIMHISTYRGEHPAAGHITSTAQVHVCAYDLLESYRNSQKTWTPTRWMMHEEISGEQTVFLLWKIPIRCFLYVYLSIPSAHSQNLLLGTKILPMQRRMELEKLSATMSMVKALKIELKLKRKCVPKRTSREYAITGAFSIVSHAFCHFTSISLPEFAICWK